MECRAVNYLSVCAGIEAATVAWHDLGWKATAYSEIEPFPSAVLAHHYLQTPNLGDMTRYRDWSIDEPINLLVGGTPCQSFSVAGLRKGLDDPRGNLALVYLGIADHFRPRWIVWENVPGVLSSNKGRDFGSFLGALGELGYGWAYRVLDAQFFGVAQRRRRVFVVGCLGDWASAAAVLFERQSLRRDTAPSREAGQKAAPAVSTGAPFSRTGNERVEADAMVVQPKPASNVAHCLETTCNDYSRADGFNMVMQPAYGIPGNWIGRKPENGGNAVDPMHNVSPCLTSTDKHGVAQPTVLMDQGGSVMNVMDDGTVGTLRRETHGHEPSIVQNMAVRRLTPTECERLQGFPDDYTRIAWRKKKPEDCPDGHRYKALGNSMAVPVMRWIGKRIAQVEAIK